MSQAVKKFVEFWKLQRGSEKGEDQKFWNMLLSDVLGVGDIATFIQYQVPVHFKGTTKFLDAWIPSTRVLIEHKTRGVDLDAPQAGHDGLTPFGQAWDYDNNLPLSEKARWIVVCNFDEIRIHDMEADVPETTFERITLGHLAKEVHRLKFLVRAENAIRARELEVSVKAGRAVGKLYNAFLDDYANRGWPRSCAAAVIPERDLPDAEYLKVLNQLCVRLVFCVYAEDAGVFAKDQFLDFLRKFHFSSLHLQLAELFKVLRLKPEERGPFFSEELQAFPYVGGGLFKEEIPIAPFSEKTAKILLDDASERFDWSEISPTIFGAVFESTLNPETRRQDGMHYTSEENIHKVIDPLFLDALRAELEEIKAEPNLKKRTAALVAFQEKLGKLRFLDPACGSGNFLTETYISLRKLENEALALRFKGQGQFDLGDTKLIQVSINQFYGIEINDFAVTVAQTAMWIAECKMMQETNAILAKNFTPLPLTDSAKIVEGNALHMDWGALLINSDESECSANASHHFDYIMGNPPFVGARNKTAEQSADMMSIFVDAKGKPLKAAGNIDYVAAWYWKACEYSVGGTRSCASVADDTEVVPLVKTRCAFVSTNSITQGEQVAAVWKPLKERFGLEIDYAWTTFVWDSEATEKAHVHVVIVGFHVGNYEPCRSVEDVEMRSVSGASDKSELKTKRLFNADGAVIEARHINGYLMDGPDVFVESRSLSICAVPEMGIGNKPIDGGNYLFTEAARDEFIAKEPESASYFRTWLGSEEFINGKKRYCLWLGDATPAELRSMPCCLQRIQAVRNFRLASKSAGTRKIADTPTRFHVENFPTGNYLLVPSVSSERREYVPMGFLSPDVFASNLVLIVPNATLYHFGVLTSSVHMAWMRVVAGRLEMRYRYSAAIVYNNFPWPDSTFSTDLHGQIAATAQAILDARALYSDSSLADLYDPLTMPPELRQAHQKNDAAVMKAYGFPSDLDEAGIVARLFEMYAELVDNRCKSRGDQA